MRLSKIRLSGFKSFVDPTTISFPGNLMAVVGPNGCGKSNIIDAIRWVLGESSAKTLRGDSMADVIFNGSRGRKPVGQASIELLFDNSDGSITGAYAGYAEISVRRVVSRDGTSQYFLNGSRCRRKDITQILLGTGLGSHGYSIIEQGMISRLVEAKPEELRAFLEEAAGISKYKERRRETEHRIRHTRDNLERLTDLRDEVDKQLNHLQRQARAAERYKKLKEEERQTQAELLALRYKNLHADRAQQEGELRVRQLKLDEVNTERQRVESEIEKLRVAQADSGEKLSAAQGSYYRLGAEIARLEQSIQHRKETMARQHKDLQATRQQLAEIREHIANDRVELEQLEQVLSTLNPDLEQSIREQEAADEELRQAEQSMESWREQWDIVAQATADIERTVQVEQTRLEQLGVQRERVENEHRRRLDEHGALDFSGIEEQLESLVANEEKTRGACIEANRAVDTVSSQIAQLREQDKKLTRRLDEVRAELQNDRGRLASLEALQEAALGPVSRHVSDWMQAHSVADNARLAETLEVEPGWERAVEMALGTYLQAVTVDSFDELAESVAELANAGVAFVDTAMAAADTGANSETMLASRVRTPSAAARLLAGVRTAASLADAMAMRANLGEGESVVTRDGFWVGPQWLRIGGGDDPRMGVIARGEEMERLRATVAAADRRAADLTKAFSDTRGRLEQLEQMRENAQKEANRRQQIYADVRNRLIVCRTELSQLRERAQSLQAGAAELKREREALDTTARQSRAQLAAAEEEREQLADERLQLEEQRQARQQRLADARDEAESCRETAQAIAIQVESRRSSRESATAALERVQSQQQHLMRRESELQDQISGGREPLQADETALASRLDEHAVAEKQLAAARTVVEDVEAKLRDAEQARVERQERVSLAREDVDNLKLELREVQVRAEAVKEQFDETGFDLDAVSQGLPAEATIELWSENLEKLDRRIQRLGAINLAAIEEFQEQTERKRYLDEQHEDLTEALTTLENAIRKIDRETRSRFRETFDKANQGLGRLFPRLFGGGHAYLELDSDDLLSSGVSIMARPPGKRISTIHLLSGGEKALTAVALVFSIFDLNPAPFCLLDEVDAPLDEANVGRFSDIVKEMSHQVQFVLITHNKTTMESMEQLVGVTMNEPGVSRLVAVDIDEAVQLAAM